MTEFIMEATRWVIVVEMTMLIWCSFLVHAAYSDEMPKRILWMARCGLVVAGATGFAVGANAVSGEPVTLGAYILAIMVLPAVMIGAVICTHVLNEAYKQHLAFREAVADIDGYAPCTNPDCIKARHRLHEIARRQ